MVGGKLVPHPSRRHGSPLRSCRDRQLAERPSTGQIAVLSRCWPGLEPPGDGSSNYSPLMNAVAAGTAALSPDRRLSRDRSVLRGIGRRQGRPRWARDCPMG